MDKAGVEHALTSKRPVQELSRPLTTGFSLTFIVEATKGLLEVNCYLYK